MPSGWALDMRSYRYAVGVIISVMATGVAATACTKSTTGHATHTSGGAPLLREPFSGRVEVVARVRA